MKDKVYIFIIGVLVGAVIATGAFFAYTKINGSNNNGPAGMNGSTPPEMPSGQNGGQPPEIPSDNNTQNSNTQESN